MNAGLLTDSETCPRKAHYSQNWQAKRLISSRMTHESVLHGLTTTEGDPGEAAGGYLMGLAEDRGLDTTLHEAFPTIVHHAALADVLVTALRQPGEQAWATPISTPNWLSSCLMSPDGRYLRRVIGVSHWTDEREESEKRSWYTMGEIAAYELPMQLAVLVIGQQKNGKRHSPWTKGFLHPKNHQLRFRRKQRVKSETFSEGWDSVLREDHAEIERETWLNAMLKDDVLPEVCFSINIPVPSSPILQSIREMVERKSERIAATKELPERNLSSCDWPVPCAFKRACWGATEREPSEKNGFVRISDATFSPSAKY